MQVWVLAALPLSSWGPSAGAMGVAESQVVPGSLPLGLSLVPRNTGTSAWRAGCHSDFSFLLFYYEWRQFVPGLTAELGGVPFL